ELSIEQHDRSDGGRRGGPGHRPAPAVRPPASYGPEPGVARNLRAKGTVDERGQGYRHVAASRARDDGGARAASRPPAVILARLPDFATMRTSGRVPGLRCPQTSTSGPWGSVLILQVPPELKELPEAKVSSMSWRYTILPVLTFAWMENGGRNDFPRALDR